jgi:hypothetical protein
MGLNSVCLPGPMLDLLASQPELTTGRPRTTRDARVGAPRGRRALTSGRRHDYVAVRNIGVHLEAFPLGAVRPVAVRRRRRGARACLVGPGRRNGLVAGGRIREAATGLVV